MKNDFNNNTGVNIRDIGVILNVHAFVVYSFLLQSGIKYTKDRYGRGYVNGEDITLKFEGLKAFVKSLRNGRKTQIPFKELAFINLKIGIHNDWESKADGLDKVKKVFHASHSGDIYRINHYPDLKRSLFRWDRVTRAWRYLEGEETARNHDGWMESILAKYNLCHAMYDDEHGSKDDIG